eukprot:m.282293 g.282293  ORF g.282293 m.282293 type:complete len:166 (-) comp19845_c2_seq1:126-623(-)
MQPDLGKTATLPTPPQPQWVQSLFAKQQAESEAGAVSKNESDSVSTNGGNTLSNITEAPESDCSSAKPPKPARPPRPPREASVDPKLSDPDVLVQTRGPRTQTSSGGRPASILAALHVIEEAGEADAVAFEDGGGALNVDDMDTLEMLTLDHLLLATEHLDISLA